MIIFDTETSDLTAPEAAPIHQQPYIIELAALKVDPKTFKVLDRLEFLCSIPVPLKPEITEITGITPAMLKGKPPIAAHLPAMQEFFLGERHLVAHNLAFDRDMVRHELIRHGLTMQFPWPPIHICTVEASMSLEGYRLNLGKLHKMLLGKEHTEAHRAMKDVEALASVVKALAKKGLVNIA